MHQLGLEALLTILIPGLILTCAFGVLVHEELPDDFEALTHPLDTSLLTGTTLLVAAGALGSVLAGLGWVIELWILDPFTAWRINVCRDQFDWEWDCYIDRLTGPEHHNSHVSRLVQQFYFEWRVGLASPILLIALLTTNVVSWQLEAALFLFTVIAVADASRIHRHLANFRHRNHKAGSAHQGILCQRSECNPRAGTTTSKP